MILDPTNLLHMSTYLRPSLADYSSIVCFKAVIVGVEDTPGPDGAAVCFIRAGKVRGEALAKSLGHTGTNPPVKSLAKTLDEALGQDGTRLCRVTGARQEGDKIIVETDETVCPAGEDMGSDRTCTFTLGAVCGALEAATGKRYLPKHTGSVLRGGTHDVFEFTQL